MPPSSRSGTCSVSRRSESGSYSTMAGLPSTVASNRPRSGSALALPGLCTLAMTGGAVSTRQLTALRICFRSAAASLMPARLSASSTRSRKRLWSSNSASPSAARSSWRPRPGGRRAPRSSDRAASCASSRAGPSWRCPLRRRPRPRRCPSRPGASPARPRPWRKLVKRSSPNSSYRVVRMSSSPDVKRSVSMALSVSWLCRRSGRSTVTFQ